MVNHNLSGSSNDKVPLNKSFDTAETSDSTSWQAPLSRNRSLASVWRVLEEKQNDLSAKTKIHPRKEIEEKNLPSSRSSGPKTESGRIDLSSHYSPRLPPLELEDEHVDWKDDSEPRALVVPRPQVPQMPSVQQRAEVQEPYDPEFYDNMVAIDPDLNPRWRIFQQQAEVEQGVEVTISGKKYPAENSEKQSAQEADYPRERARALLRASGGEGNEPESLGKTLWTAWSCGDRKKRRNIACFLLVMLVVVAAVGFVVGYYGNGSMTTTAASATGPADGSDSSPALSPSGQDDRTPSIAPIMEVIPTISPIFQTRRPVQGGTVPPNLFQPTSVPIQSPQTDAPTSISLSPAPAHAVTTPPVMETTQNPTARPIQRPSSRPMPRPSPRPSSHRPTPNPTPYGETNSDPTVAVSCPSVLVVDKDCYASGRDVITVEFFNCDPQENDWIGIWYDDEDPTRLGDDYVDWVWSCGTKDCLGAPSRARIVFETFGLGIHLFRAYLINEFPSKDPFQADARSLSFLVTRNCTRA